RRCCNSNPLPACYEILVWRFDTLLSCRTEPAFAAFGLAQAIRPDIIANGGAFDDQLRNALAGFEAYRSVAEIDQQHSQLRAIVTVNNAGEHVYAMVDGQS